MKLDLAVIGQGAVSPAGLGVEALKKVPPNAVIMAGLRKPKETWPIFRVDLNAPDLQRWQREPRLRRASPITLFLIVAAEQALAGLAPEARAETGLIIALSAGCLAYSRRFFEGIVKEGRANPVLFPETVFNSPGSHVAAALKLNGAVYALVGDEGAWVAALKTAAIWLQAGRVKQMLVLGAEEFDPLVIDAYVSARWLRKSSPFRVAEGAAGLLVRPAKPGDKIILTEVRDGFIYRTPREAAAAAEKLFCEIESPCYPTAQNTWLGSLEKKMMAGRHVLAEKSAPYLGEAFTASAAWNTIRALDRLSPERPALMLPFWGLNHQLGLIELQRRD